MTPEQQAALRAPFPAPEKLTKTWTGKDGREKSMTLDYVGHALVTDRLLSVDPEWTWAPMATDQNGFPILTENGGLWITLTVAGVTRPGYGDAQNSQTDPVKEAIGDAIRNAAMRFGVALDLWVKDKPRPLEAAPVAAQVQGGAASSAQIGMIQGQMKKAGITERDDVLDRIGQILGIEVKSSRELSRTQASKVIDAMEKVTA